MFPFQSYPGEDSLVSSALKVEKKQTEACKSHKEAERRRRQRINAHLSTLRTLLPGAIKVLIFSFSFNSFITVVFAIY